jgi:[acyl-carrier-protein] S-malonyltransferase
MQTELDPSYVAGHSLGELSALVAAEALDFPTALLLTRERGRLMKEAGRMVPGGMAAVIQMGEQELAQICREASDGRGSVQIANYNSPGQVVISGENKSLERAMSLARERGARRVIPLTVSIAGHSPLMRPAAEKFATVIAQSQFQPARIPLVANASARPIQGVAEVKEELVVQLTSPVRWTQSIRFMIERGVQTFVELGPGKVLSGLLRRIDGQVEAYAVGDAPGLEILLANLKGR